MVTKETSGEPDAPGDLTETEGADATPMRRPRAVPAGRISRFGRITGLATGLAGGMALNGARSLVRGERPRLETLVLTPENIARLTDQLARMRGAAMKLGQLLSMETGDALSPELSAILARLRADADFMPPRQLKTVLEATYGTSFRHKFQAFDTTPLAAASIGQVHRATARDGRRLAIKVQYPGVRAAIDSDIDNVAALIRWSGLWPKELDLAPLLAEARVQLHEEADYLREGACLMQFSELLADDPRFVVPRFAADLSGPDALAMSFEPSEPIETLAQAPAALRDAAVTALIELCLRELFEFRMMQTDPNFANFRWRPDTGQIVLLDFGATRAIAPAVANGHLRLLRAGLVRDRAGSLAALSDLGFIRRDLDPRHHTTLLDMAEMGFGALRGVYDFAADDLAKRLRARGMEIGDERALWHIPPPETLFIQRKIGGLYLLASRLGARVDFPALLANAVPAA